MGNTKVAKLETYEGVPTLCTKKRQVARALELVVQFLGLENGSLKIFLLKEYRYRLLMLTKEIIVGGLVWIMVTGV